MGRLEVETYEDGETIRYAYDNSGNLATVTDSATGVVTTYYYDLLNRQSGYREQGTNYDHSVVYTYDAENNLSSMTEVINGVTKKYSYTYDEYNKLISETVGDVADNGDIINPVTVEYEYDDFGRLEERVVKNGTTEIYSIEPSYSAGATANTTSTQVASYNGDTYTYDANGNITSIYTEGSLVSYTYDSQGQLIWEKSDITGYATQWEYDNAGNIVSREVYDYGLFEIGESIDTVNYGYQDPDGWGDLLTSYDGRTITYDEIGNPLSDGEWTYTWKRGRQLASMTKGNTTWTYTYDASGMRTKRTNGMDTYTYIYNGSKLTRLIVDAQEYFDFYFTYDASGTPLTVTENGYTYYYVTNLQGDVIGIKDSSGNQVVSYDYDAWGKLLYRTNTQLADYNPLRYRGYVYDFETGLYYLQSRYYNPEWGRFINGDAFATTGQGFVGNNMFAYCGNNPSVNQDCFGTFFERTAGGGGGGAGYCSPPSDNSFWSWLFGWSRCAEAAAATAATTVTTVAVTTTLVTGKINDNSPTFKLSTKDCREEKFKTFAYNQIYAYKQESTEYYYWEADRTKGTVIIGRGLSIEQACVRVSMGFNVMCKNENAARAIILINRYRNAVGPEIHPGEGYYWHYHPNRSSHIHIWYYS